MRTSKLLLALTLIMCVFALTACGGTDAVDSAKWPADFSEIPEFTASPINNLEEMDENTVSMEFLDVTEQHLLDYSDELVAAGFTYEPVNGNVYTKVAGDLSFAVGWDLTDSTMQLFLMKGTAEEGLGEVVVQWPIELDGITPFQGFTPNQAFMNPEGLVTIDYSDVTEKGLNDYREALLADGFEPFDLGTGVETYARVDQEGNSYLVLINPQNDVEGHLQISGIISTPEE